MKAFVVKGDSMIVVEDTGFAVDAAAAWLIAKSVIKKTANHKNLGIAVTSAGNYYATS